MELIIGLVVMALALAAVIAGIWFAVRAFKRLFRKPAPLSVAPAAGAPSAAGVSALRTKLQELRSQGFTLDDDGGDKLTLKLPLVAAGSVAGKVSEEYRIIVKLDEKSKTARLSERRISKESGFGGGGMFQWSASKGPTAGASDIKESGGAAGPGGSGGSYRLDAASARALVERTVAEAGWRVG